MTKDAATGPARDLRRKLLESWLQSVLGEPLALSAVSEDASFRRYFRATLRDGSTRIAMDAPPQYEDTRRFLDVAGLMRRAGVHVPEVFAADPDRGFVLLSDLGARTYLDVLDESNADALFDDALVALVRWQCASRPNVLPSYDAVLLRRELDLFPEWYAARCLGRTFDERMQEAWEQLCGILVESALAQPQVFVHRDFMVRNLMVCEPCPGVLDFQDAVVGPMAYDVLSLFRDAGLTWDEARIAQWVAGYLRKARAAGLPVPADPSEFSRMFDLVGVQRHLKVVGIFARLAYRDGKRRYLGEIPRILGFLRGVVSRYDECAPLERIFDALEMAN